jgi:hypothetical protein
VDLSRGAAGGEGAFPLSQDTWSLAGLGSRDSRQFDSDHGGSSFNNGFDGGGGQVETAGIGGKVVQQERELGGWLPRRLRRKKRLTFTLQLTFAKCETIWDWSALSRPAKYAGGMIIPASLLHVSPG